MKVFVASDHAGYKLKEAVKKEVENMGHDVTDIGTESESSCNYPEYARGVCIALVNGKADMGIAICGSGVGMSIAANRFKGIRAALCNDIYTAKYSRLHNDANLLSMGSRVVGEGLALEIVKTWINTPFEGGRHQERVCMIDD